MMAAVFVPLGLGAIGMGGGLYETLLVDRVWPRQPQLVQPGRGGINRKLFWGPLNGLSGLALVVCVWAVWAEPLARGWALLALACHIGARAWSWAYFIPAALRFETLGDFDSSDAARARRWTRLSIWRLPLGLAELAALSLAGAALA
jgi:hypothetical protein